MAAGSSYPFTVTDDNGIERLDGTLNFADSTNQPSPGGSSNIATAQAFAPTGMTGAISATRYVGGTASVAPTTGAHLAGDFVTTLTGRMFVCTVAGTPGTWVEPASVTFAPLASPTFTGTVTVPAAAAVTSAPRISQLTSALTTTSGALADTGSWVSGTAKQNPTTVTVPARQVVVVVEVVTDGTANAATCAIAISPDNTTYTTVGTPGASVGVNTAGAVTLVSSVTVPANWYIKLTLAHCAVAASIYY